ncbi:MAG: hypothetical protein V3T84_17960 [Phycisphaerales bacterium]
MYLPIILLRQFGWWGFIAFAMPNVVGCIAFGYVLKRATSRQLVRRHGPAMRAFSFVVVVYHMFFLPFAAAAFVLSVPNFVPQAQGDHFGLVLAVAVMAAAIGLSRLPTRLWPALATLTFAFSLVAFAQLGAGSLGDITWSGETSLRQLLWLAPIFAFGFGLCPYLDLTFHRARGEAPSRHVFAVFGLTFAMIIVFTCAYAFQMALTPLVAGHIITQSVFTVAAHLREIRTSTPKRPRSIITGIVLVGLLVAALSSSIHLLDRNSVIGQEMYLRLLVFFGLVFPAYVLLFIGPGKTLTPTRANVMIYLVVVAAALPLYELGFLHERAWMAALALAALLAWRLLAQFVPIGVKHS